MKWNVEEANRKTGQYRTVSVDAPDPAAADALGKFMGLSASDLTQVASRHGARTRSSIARAGAARGRLSIRSIVLLTAGVTLTIAMGAVWVIRPFSTPPVVESSPNAMLSEDGGLNPVKWDGADDSKEKGNATEMDRDTDSDTTTADFKQPEEADAQDDLVHE